MWGRTTKQRRSAVRRRAEVARATEENERERRRLAAYDSAIREGQRRAKNRASKAAVKFQVPSRKVVKRA